MQRPTTRFPGSQRLVTHSYVLSEFVAVARARGMPRQPALEFERRLRASAAIEVLFVDEQLHERGIRLLEQRLDKEWSLCDAVSFGVAPALLLVRLGPDFHPAFLWPIAALFLMAVLLRLARFNIESETDDHHEWFTGLPSPAAGGLIASLAIVAAVGWPDWLPSVVQTLLPSAESVLRITSNATPCVALLLSALMVSHFRYPHLVSQLLRGQWHATHWMTLAIAVLGTLVMGAWIGPLALTIFALAAPLRSAWKFFTGTTVQDAPRPVFGRFRARARRGDDPPASGHPNPPLQPTDKRGADERQRPTKARKVRM